MTTERAVERALCRSAVYEALALGFRAPTAETRRRLASPVAEGLAVAAEHAAGAAVGALARRLAAGTAPLEALDASYRDLFGHTARGPVPLCETEYGGDTPFLQPQELADLGGFYAAFGLTLAPDARERADHVSCECEFLMFLARKEAVALERNDAATREATEAATRLFLRDHLARWAPSVAAWLEREDADGFYGALARLAAAVLVAECARLGVRGAPAALSLRPAEDDRVPMACGQCPAGVPGADGDGD
jgi:putative dimethyl sulfoxide reductase chaperone